MRGVKATPSVQRAQLRLSVEQFSLLQPAITAVRA